MASRNIGNIYAQLSLKDTNFQKGLKAARKHLNDFGKTGMIAAAGGAAAIGTALVAGTKHTLSMTDELVDLSNQTGLAVADMMVLQRAYADGGRAAEMTGKDIGKMQKALVTANEGGNDPFARIGLSAKDLMAMNPAAQFSAIGEAIMRMQNPAERTATAMEIFGKGGMGLTTVFEGLPSAVQSLGRMPELAQRFGKAMGEANDLIGHLPMKSDQFFMGFTAGIIGELLPSLRMIDDHDFTTMGENIGQAVATGFSALTDGTLWEIINLQAYKGIMTMSGMMFTNFGRTIDFLAAGFNAIFSGGPGTFMERFAGEIANIAEGNVLQPEIDKIQAAIDAAWNDSKSKVRSGESGPTTPISNPITRAPEPIEVKTPKIEVTTPEKIDVNEYQRRGLSLNGAGGGMESETKKQTNILEQVRDLLRKDLALNPPATW